MKQTRETLITTAENGIHFFTGIELDYEFENQAEHEAFSEGYENALNAFRELLEAYKQETQQEQANKVYLFDPTERTEAGGFPVYIGLEDENGEAIGLEILSPAPSQAIVNHSPNGFNWGYGGSGPAQCALGILLDMTGDETVATRWYQTFKSEVIAQIPTDKKMQMSETKIREWLQQKTGDVKQFEFTMETGERCILTEADIRRGTNLFYTEIGLEFGSEAVTAICQLPKERIQHNHDRTTTKND